MGTAIIVGNRQAVIALTQAGNIGRAIGCQGGVTVGRACPVDGIAGYAIVNADGSRSIGAINGGNGILLRAAKDDGGWFGDGSRTGCCAADGIGNGEGIGAGAEAGGILDTIEGIEVPVEGRQTIVVIDGDVDAAIDGAVAGDVVATDIDAEVAGRASDDKTTRLRAVVLICERQVVRAR